MRAATAEPKKARASRKRGQPREKTRIVFRWRRTVHPKLDAQVAGEELERIRIANGDELTNAAVVDAAREKTSPFHPLFEWDVSKAARAHWLHTAANIKNNVDRVTINVRFVDNEEQETEIARAPAFVFVRSSEDNGEPHHQSINVVERQEDVVEQVLADAVAALRSFYVRAKQLGAVAKRFPKTVAAIETELAAHDAAMAAGAVNGDAR